MHIHCEPKKTPKYFVISSTKLKSILIGCVAVACQNNQAYLITAGFLLKHSYERKNFAVVSINRHQLQRDFVPWPPDQVLYPWTPLGAQPPYPTAAPTSLPEIFLALSVKEVVLESIYGSQKLGLSHPMYPIFGNGSKFQRSLSWQHWPNVVALQTLGQCLQSYVGTNARHFKNFMQISS